MSTVKTVRPIKYTVWTKFKDLLKLKQVAHALTTLLETINYVGSLISFNSLLY